jgi:hypothetical protein
MGTKCLLSVAAGHFNDVVCTANTGTGSLNKKSSLFVHPQVYLCLLCTQHVPGTFNPHLGHHQPELATL